MPEGTAACERCGSVYRITSMPVLARRRDALDCEVCGATLLRWTEAVEYYADLVKRGPSRLEPQPEPEDPITQGP